MSPYELTSEYATKTAYTLKPARTVSVLEGGGQNRFHPSSTANLLGRHSMWIEWWALALMSLLTTTVGSAV